MRLKKVCVEEKANFVLFNVIMDVDQFKSCYDYEVCVHGKRYKKRFEYF